MPLTERDRRIALVVILITVANFAYYCRKILRPIFVLPNSWYWFRLLHQTILHTHMPLYHCHKPVLLHEWYKECMYINFSEIIPSHTGWMVTKIVAKIQYQDQRHQTHTGTRQIILLEFLSRNFLFQDFKNLILVLENLSLQKI